MNVTVIFVGPGTVEWAAPADGVLSDASLTAGGPTDVVISKGVEDDAVSWAALGAAAAYDKFIAAFQTGSAGEFHRAVGERVLKGESIFFSADASAEVSIQFTPIVNQ